MKCQKIVGETKIDITGSAGRNQLRATLDFYQNVRQSDHK